MSAHRKAVVMATATLQDIISKGKTMQGHGMRGSSAAEQEPTRSEAHSLLDAYLDHMAEAGAHVRATIED